MKTIILSIVLLVIALCIYTAIKKVNSKSKKQTNSFTQDDDHVGPRPKKVPPRG